MPPGERDVDRSDAARSAQRTPIYDWRCAHRREPHALRQMPHLARVGTAAPVARTPALRGTRAAGGAEPGFSSPRTLARIPGPVAQEVAVPTASRPEAQLPVAAVRILEHQHRRPPAIDEIAELLRYSKEFTGHLVRALEPLGIVHTIKSPFEVRVEVRDHLKIETLPAEDRGPGFKDEVD